MTNAYLRVFTTSLELLQETQREEDKWDERS